VRLPFQARGDGGLYAEQSAAIDVFRPSLSIQVRPATNESTEVGTPITFNIDVTNTGDRPLSNVSLRAVGDSGMTHTQTGSRVVGQAKSDGPLQPGQTWTSAATFVPLESGRRCINVEAIADGAQRAAGESCATVINKVMPVPAVTAQVTGREIVETGSPKIFRYRIVNTGQVPLRNVRIAATFEAPLQLVRATEGSDTSRIGQYQIVWTIPLMQPGPDTTSTVLLEGEFLPIQANPRSKMILTVSSAEGARAEDVFEFQIVAGPTVTPPPAAGAGGSSATPAAGALALTLLDRDDPVRVGQPMRYSLSVKNNSDQFDGNVGVRFQLPTGVEVVRVAQRLAPGATGMRREGNLVYLDDIRDLRPGETVDYDLELRSNQPQDVEIVVEAISRLVPAGVRSSQQTRVIQ
jgi:hypothetical protein